MEKKTKETRVITKQVAVVAGVAAGVAALSAASYFIFGPDGKKNRKQAKGWSLKMKGEIVERLEKLKDVTPEVYNGIIDEVSTKYGKLKNVQATEIAEIAQDLKKHWDAISRDIERGERVAKKRVVKPKAEVSKKVSQKTSKKGPQGA